MTQTVRPYDPLDKSACLHAFISNVPLYFTQGEIALFEAFLDKFQDIKDGKLEDGTHYYVLLENERVLGCGGFGHHDDSDIIFMAWGLVHNDFHKKGFGEKTQEKILESIQFQQTNEGKYLYAQVIDFAELFTEKLTLLLAGFTFQFAFVILFLYIHLRM